MSNNTAGLIQISGISAELVNMIRKVHIIFIKPYLVVKLGNRRFPGANDYLRVLVFFRFLALYERPERFELLVSFDYFNESH